MLPFLLRCKIAWSESLWHCRTLTVALLDANCLGGSIRVCLLYNITTVFLWRQRRSPKNGTHCTCERYQRDTLSSCGYIWIPGFQSVHQIYDSIPFLSLGSSLTVLTAICRPSSIIPTHHNGSSRETNLICYPIHSVDLVVDEMYDLYAETACVLVLWVLGRLYVCPRSPTLSR